jgi:DNA-binding response OmpR family regulator
MRILIVDNDATAAAVAEALRRRGHVVETAASAGEALERPAPGVLVLEIDLCDASGPELLARFHERSLRPHAVFVAARPTVEACRQALLLGAADFLAKPFRLDELVRSVESAREGEHGRARYRRSYGSRARDVERAARELAAHGLALGLGPSCRARIASAAAEAFDNVRAHAYPAGEDRGFEVEADVQEREILVTVTDRGVGFDPACVAEHAFDSALHNGLARAACLAEDVQLDSRPGGGARVTLRFAAYRSAFDEDQGLDLTEVDFLTPELSKQVLRALELAEADPFRLSPALAVSIGRLLAGPDPRKRLQLALWS